MFRAEVGHALNCLEQVIGLVVCVAIQVLNAVEIVYGRRPALKLRRVDRVEKQKNQDEKRFMLAHGVEFFAAVYSIGRDE